MKRLIIIFFVLNLFGCSTFDKIFKDPPTLEEVVMTIAKWEVKVDKYFELARALQVIETISEEDYIKANKELKKIKNTLSLIKDDLGAADDLRDIEDRLENVKEAFENIEVLQ